jgi:CDP-diacylglycerol--serine O-phosphatidyltransferase
VFAGAAFDVLDGLAARALGRGGSEFGKQLDSLADMVTFGVAPGMLLFKLPLGLAKDITENGNALDVMHNDPWVIGLIDSGSGGLRWLPIATMILIAACSAWRLAKFNIDEKQRSGFLGLPTPANALFWSSLPLIVLRSGTTVTGGSESLRMLAMLISTPLLSLILAVVLGWLMLSEVPLPSLKFKHMKWRGNEVIYLLGGTGVVLVLLYGILAVPLILLLYLLSPLWGKLFPKTA